MADSNTENVADLFNIAAYNDYDESGESDLEDLNGEERTDMPADGDMPAINAGSQLRRKLLK